MKVCSKCKEEKPLEDFPVNKTKKDGRGHACKTCQRAYCKAHYNKDKDYYVKKAAKYNAKSREIMRKTKEAPCMDCKQSYPYYVMDFDHVGEKCYTPAHLSKGGQLKKFLEEIKKCELVCANCHRIRTHNRLNAAVV